MVSYLQHPLVKGALSGFLSAAAIDFVAFRNFKTLDEFASYSWAVAGFRWIQGAVVGAVTAAGLGAL